MKMDVLVYQPLVHHLFLELLDFVSNSMGTVFSCASKNEEIVLKLIAKMSTMQFRVRFDDLINS